MRVFWRSFGPAPQHIKESSVITGFRTSSLALGLALALPAAQAAFVVSVGFDELAFTSGVTNVTNTTQSYNVFNDTTGAEFTGAAPAGDRADFSIAFSSLGATRSAPSTPTVNYQATTSGRFTSTRGFSNSPALTVNNPGTVESTTMTLLFGSQLRVTSLSAAFLSLNTAGVAFEYSIISLLRPDGSYFSAPPTVGLYNSFAGMNGMAGVGNYIAADKQTVTGVGTAQTVSGTNGPSDDLTLTYGLVGLAAGTQIGGIQVINFLQDVRGPVNGTTGTGITTLTASFTDFTITADAVAPLAVPEPASLALVTIGALGLLGRGSSALLADQPARRTRRRGEPELA
jgi:hypothetical protein